MGRVGFLVVLTGTAVLAAGCGTVSARAAGVASAVANTEGKSARLAQTTTMRTGGMSVSFTETGLFDFARSRGVLRMRGPAGMASEERFVSPELYVQLPAGAKGPLPRGKSWIGIRVGASGGFVGSVLGPFGGTDPADLLAALTAVSARVTRLGSGAVRGVPVTGYRVSVDPAKAESRVPRWERAGLRAFARSLGAATIPVDVWIDHRNLVRRLRVSLRPPAGLGTRPGARLIQTLDFYDFGVPVRVSAPPAAAVASISQLAGTGAAGSFSSGIGGSARPPRVSGTLSPVQGTAAEHVVREFWSALGRHDAAAAARTVLPAQRACFRSMSNGLRFTVTSLQITSARPAGSTMATVRFSVTARVRLGGHSIPVLPQGPGHVQWLVTTFARGHWYLDLARSTSLVFGSACPGR